MECNWSLWNVGTKTGGQVVAIKTDWWLSDLKIKELKQEIENSEPYEEIKEQMEGGYRMWNCQEWRKCKGVYLGKNGWKWRRWR